MFGGSYADIFGHLFGVKSIQTIYDVFEDVITWINMSFSFPLVSILLKLKKGYDDENEEMIQESVSILKAMSQDFGVDSDNTFLGCIGSHDGIDIRISRPTLSKMVRDLGNYFCRKNFFALNVQAICDRKKKITWMSPGHQGSAHDSTAW